MPKNFPEIWEQRVRQTLKSGDTADFLDGVNELDGDVQQMGEENVIHIPTTEFSPDVLINNKTYPLAVQDYDDDTVIVKLDKYQTKPTKVTDDQIIGSSYDKIDAVTRSHTNAISSRKFKKALHALAPDSNTDKTPVLELAGAECTYEDLVALKDKCDALEWPEEGRRLVLCNKHYNALLKDRKNFGDQLINYRKGEVSPVIAGFEIKKYIASPHYASGNKKAFGEVVGQTDKPASVAFVVENVKKKTGLTKQYFSEASKDTENQANLLNYRHYFIAVPVEKKFIASLI
ncbi:Endo/exonuclease/phosphatase domain-containing protein [Candidatus Ornithobacterium hominis]|uniref:phage major capsid protein n=1 Tax=Candidatus Ornithobacterium hominis TaxID=2497989 RepID=UPI0024BC87EA|nr:hypothetical protein [Candidatus Ornithobacterium hominis]CAI9429258.1 Endo/exonuclease/phosphatase domain-containing protein [Candidatus Ornithobacterium hominis]